MASKPFSFQTRLTSVMEVMARAVVREVCEMVDGDLACLRLELARALNEKTALSVKMHELESEVETLRNTGARSPAKKYRSVCIQTLEELDAPSINGIFGKEWCSSLWDGREPRAEEKATEVEPAVPDESELHDHSKTLAIKEENSEKEICSSNTTAAATPGRRNNPSSPSEPNEVQDLSLIDDGDDDNQDSEDIYFISAGFLGAPDVHPMPSGFERSDFTKIISSDGTVKHLILPSDDQLEFDEHCMPIEFIEGERPEAQSFGGQQEDLFLEAENTSSLGSAENLTYFDRFDLQEEPEREMELAKTPKFSCLECGKTFLRQSSLTLHKKCHQRHNSHTCNSCKVVFPQMNLLRTHKCLPPDNQSKTLNQKFGCEQCGKRFHSRANLRVHYAVHTGERPHRCSYCGRGFTQKGNLNTHERIHRGEKPFVCLTCGKRFTQKVNLNHHLGIHSGIRQSKTRKSAEKSQCT
ncbi:zinc finger protein 2 [Pygocentrus nattereri]|uniref:zinc finger protein 2 n=1 Tax=Pygocentrus nattereri TaxID=42514 RepID=UPI001891AB81|nr:zinc finger protein 2 [Pygocentrus nattereri]